MANALNQQIADDIASLVRKQTFSGSGVWRQSGTATLRIQNQTNSIVEALGRIPSKETQEEEEKEDDKQHEELVGAIEGTGKGGGPKKKKGFFGSLLSGIGTIGKGLFSGLSTFFGFFGKLGKFILGPVFKGIGTILSGALKGVKWLFKGLGFVAVAAGLIAAAVFFNKSPEDQKKIINKFMGFVEEVGNFFTTIGNAFKGGFMEGFDDVTEMVDGKEVVKEEGLGTKLKNFTEAWGKVFDKIFGAFEGPFKIGTETYSGAEGLAKGLGKAFSDVLGFIVDLGTGIADVITDPAKALGTLQGNIMTLFDDLYELITRFWHEGIANPRTWRELAKSFGITNETLLSKMGLGKEH